MAPTLEEVRAALQAGRSLVGGLGPRHGALPADHKPCLAALYRVALFLPGQARPLPVSSLSVHEGNGLRAYFNPVRLPDFERACAAHKPGVLVAYLPEEHRGLLLEVRGKIAVVPGKTLQGGAGFPSIEAQCETVEKVDADGYPGMKRLLTAITPPKKDEGYVVPEMPEHCLIHLAFSSPLFKPARSLMQVEACKVVKRGEGGYYYFELFFTLPRHLGEDDDAPLRTFLSTRGQYLKLGVNALIEAQGGCGELVTLHRFFGMEVNRHPYPVGGLGVRMDFKVALCLPWPPNPILEILP